MSRGGIRRAIAVVALVGLAVTVLAAAPADAATAPAGSGGALDPTFGSGGVATVTVPGLTLTALTKVIPQPDGKILVGGLQPGTSGSVAVARLNANGTLDTTFGAPNGYVKPGLGSTSSADGAQIGLQPDGKILVVGSKIVSGAAAVATTRLNANGTIDTSFASGGTATLAFGSSMPQQHGSAIAVLPTGQVLVGIWLGPGHDAFKVIRYSSTGVFDTGFGSSGLAISHVVANAPAQATDIAVQADGKIVEVGSVTVTHNGVSQNDTAVARFTSAGQPDTTFPGPSGNSQGAEVLDRNTTKSDAATAIVLDSSGRMNISGTISSSPSSAYVMRLSSTGGLDSTFGTGGVLSGTFGGAAATGGGAAFDGTGRLLVAGGDGASTTNALGVERLLSTGTSPYDATFGVSTTPGRETVACATGTGAGTAVGVQANQQILLGGFCAGTLKVARLNPGNLSNLTMVATAPNSASGHQVVPLGSIPASVLTASAGALGGTTVRGNSVFGAPFGQSPFGQSPFGQSPFGQSPFGQSPFGQSPFGQSPFGQSPFGQSGIPAILISEIPLAAPKTWDQQLAGTPCANEPIQTLTLDDVNANCASALTGLTIADVQANATPLRNVSYAAFALGWTPLANLPGSPCTFIASQAATCANNDPTKTSAFVFELKGDNLSAYYSQVAINLNGLALVQSPIPSLWLANVRLADTTLGAVLTSALHTPGTFVTCATTCPAGQTLAQSQANGQLVASSAATVGALLADSPAAVGPVPLANLLVGLLPKASLPVEQLPTTDIVASSPLPANGTAAYKVDFDMACASAPGLTVKPNLPTGFRIVPSTVTMTVGGASTPVNVSTTDGSITPQATIGCSGTQHVTVNLGAEPTTVLGGPLTSGVTVTNGIESLTASNQAPVTVVDPTDASAATSAPAASATSTDTMYVDHIGRPGNVDYFSLAPQPAGSAVIVTLSHLPADYDLVLYGPGSSSLRGAPFGQSPFGQSPFGQSPFGQSALLVSDDALSPAADGTITGPELLQDVPLVPGQTVRGASAQRGTTDEAVYTVTTEEDTTPFTIQVSGFNGASSPQPYVLRVTVLPPLTAKAPCPARNLTGGVAGTLPTSLDPATRTLILVNQKRLGDLYGAAAATNVMNKLATLAGYTDATNHDFDVKGAVLPIDGDPTVSGDYQAWDASPCSVQAANKIVTDTNKLVDRLRPGLNDLRYVVVVGSDEVVPFGRVADRSVTGNEASAGADAALRGIANAESAALSGGFVLSDNPYGDVNPSTFGATPFYVPQLAVGRLVETPTDITNAIDQYVSSNGVRTPTASFNAAYDWMKGAGQTVDSSLSPRVPAGAASTQFNDTWTRQDAKNGLQTAAHGFVSIDAHSNSSQVLSAADFASKTATPDVLSTADLPADLKNGVMLTLGCHAGLNLSDTYIANPNAGEQAALLDWSEAVLRNGGVFQGPTGYGIGDTQVLAYSGRLLGLYAQKLDGASSVGQALMFAKQQYFQLGVASVYDAKAIEEATLYGLPMYRLGLGPSVVAPSVLPALSPTPPSQTLTGVTAPAPFSTPLTQVTAPDGSGSYFTVGNEAPQATPNEPIEPKTMINLVPPGAGLVAHDAVIEQLSTKDIAGFNPVYSATSTAGGGLVPEPKVASAAFPSRLQDVVTTIGPNGASQQLVFVPGQFATDGSGTGTGNQRNVTAAQFSVNWSNSMDFTAPTINTVSGDISGSTATFRVTTPASDVKRGVLLFLPAGGPNPQAWTHVEMVNTGNGLWVGTANLASGTTTIGQFFVTLCDAAGNCGYSSNKARNYSANPTAGTFAFAIGAPGAGPNGLFPDPTNVTVTGASGTTFTVKLDGGAAKSCTTSCSIAVTGDGAHVATATATDGTAASAAIPMAHPPTVTVSAPTANARYGRGETVTSTFNCSSTVTLIGCTGPSPLDTSTNGSHTATFVATDQFGQSASVSVPYQVFDTTTVVADAVVRGVPRLNATLTDNFTHQGIPGQLLVFTYKVGTTVHPVTCLFGSGVTDSNGHATCMISLGDLTAVVSAGGFTATFNDTADYQGSSGSAGVVG
jgi:uncharacterized delta-60 repeat protein